VVEIHVEDICNDLKKNNHKFDDEIEFFKQNYKTIYSGNEENKYCYDSWQEFKIDVDFFVEYFY
jgi:hypothetical protein